MAEHFLRWFNELPAADLEERLRACNTADRFVTELTAGRPYANVAEIADTAESISLGLAWAEVGQALAAHPRIGESAAGNSDEARSSRAEQVSMGAADENVRAALAEGNRQYEARFGHVYLIRAAGRELAEMLAELRRRLRNDQATERAEVTRQLAEITRLRVERLMQS